LSEEGKKWLRTVPLKFSRYPFQTLQELLDVHELKREKIDHAQLLVGDVNILYFIHFAGEPGGVEAILDFFAGNPVLISLGIKA